MKYTPIAIDQGRSLIKAKTEQMETSFIHALVEVTDADWKSLTSREPNNKDFVKVNGIKYAVGQAAVTQGFQPRTVSAERYTSIYYGTILAVTLSRIFEKDVNNVFVYGTHAPVDVDYRRDLIAAAKGKFTIETAGVKRVFNITDARALDEPCGGMMNRILNANGFPFQNNPLKNGSVLVIDIGGQSIDIAAMDDGKPDYSSLTSEIGGTITVEESLKRQIRSDHNSKLKNTTWLRPDRIREAIRTGKFNAGAFGALDVSGVIEQSTRPILQTVNDLAQRFGGIGNYDNVILTGGGSGLLYSRIRTMFNADMIEKNLGRKYFHLADEDINNIHLANVRGGFKMLKMFERMGAMK